MRTSAVPYPTAPSDAVRFVVPWQVRTPSGALPLSDDFPGWDYQAVIDISARVEVDLDEVRTACHLGSGTRLQLVVSASSTSTKVRGLVAVVPVSTPSVSLDATMQGHELGGKLVVDTLLVATNIERSDALSPRLAGSILWRSRKTSWLEGEGSRFPTEVADLGAAPFLTPGALWFVDVRLDDLDASALGSVRLVLNESHPAVARLLAGDSAPETTAMMSALQWDVARQLVLRALECDEFVERSDGFEEDTLGAMLLNVLSIHWPGESPRSLRQLSRTEPSRFERELQDRAGLFRA